MKLRNLTKSVLVALMVASPLVGAESQYPAADFQPEIIKQDAELIKQHAEAAKATEQQDNMASISITREGPVYLESEVVTTDELKRKMLARYKTNPDIAVVLSVDKNVNFKSVVKVLDLLSELGISRLNIAAAVE